MFQPTSTEARVLYEYLPSPAVRAVKLCLRELGLSATYKTVDLVKQEHLTAAYLAINPQHIVPTLVEGDFIVWDSHAINAYLVNSYARSDALYPKDPKGRARVDQQLHFDNSVLYPALYNIGLKAVYLNRTPSEDDFARLIQAMDFLEAFLDGRKFICGNAVSIADFSVYATASSLMFIADVTGLKSYPVVERYFHDCRVTFKGASEDAEGLESFRKMYGPCLRPRS